MDNTLSVASYLYTEYARKFSEFMDEMRMHKMMYFLQRESLIELGVTLFEEPFHGWKFGPVLKPVRSEYAKAKLKNDAPFSQRGADVSETAKRLVDKVLNRYGSMSAWKLSALSHNELSWILSRKGLSAGENGNVEMDLKAMRCDALRERAKRRKQS